MVTSRALLRPLKYSVCSSIALSTHLNSVRYASLNSAIGRGIRKSQALKNFQILPNNDRRETFQGASRVSRSRSRAHRDKNQSVPEEGTGFDEDEFIRTGSFRALPREHQRFQSNLESSKYSSPSPMTWQTKAQRQAGKNLGPSAKSGPISKSQPKRRASRNETSRAHQATDTVPERVKEHVRVPDTIPYTTPASEFIYGATAVEAALRCTRRQIYKLYIYQAAGEELSAVKVALRKLALSKNIKVKIAFAGWDRLLDKMSAGRPHNGCILEASPLPRLPVKGFKAVQPEDDHFRLEIGPQSREEAVVNGSDDRITINHPQMQRRWRFPVVVLLDGIIDPGNLGAIIRSAYYLGVDAVVFAGRNSAPLSPVTIKASAGATENMTLLEVKNEVDFIQRSKANGWRFYAADAPSPTSTYLNLASVLDVNSATSGDCERSPGAHLAQSPSVIMMGSEGSGLSPHIRTQADSIVSIPGAKLDASIGVTSDPARVDSLNVSVAAALLMEMFLRVPLAVAAVPRSEKGLMKRARS